MKYHRQKFSLMIFLISDNRYHFIRPENTQPESITKTRIIMQINYLYGMHFKHCVPFIFCYLPHN